MPARGSYQIAKQDERKAGQRDQSYRSCIATLLVFFMLCMVILIACVPWKKYHPSHYNKEEDKSKVEAQHDDDRTVVSEVDTFPNIFQRYENAATTSESQGTNILKTTSDSISTLSDDINFTNPQDQSNRTAGILQTTKQSILPYNDTNDTTLSDNYEVSKSTKQEETFTTPTIVISKVSEGNSNDTEPDFETSQYSTISTDSTPEFKSAHQSITEDNTYTTTDELYNKETTAPLPTTVILEVSKENSNDTEPDFETSQYSTISTDSTPESKSAHQSITEDNTYTTTDELNNTETTTPLPTTVILEVSKENSNDTEPDFETSQYSTISSDSTPESNSTYQSITEDNIYTTTEELNNTETTIPPFTTVILEVPNENSNVTESDFQTSQYSTVSTDSTPESNSAHQSITEDNIYTTVEELNNSETTTSLSTLSSTTNSSELFPVISSTVGNQYVETSNVTEEFSSTTYESPSTSTFSDYLTNATLINTENTSTQETVIETEFSTKEETDRVTEMRTATESNIITTTTIDDDFKICNSSHCKQVASKMLSYMNHSAEACEDFYEYACGGMVADPQITDLNLANKAYHGITREMRNKNDDPALLFATYYNSCMQYENTISMKERIALANEAINEIGQFYTSNDEDNNYGDFTTLYARLLSTYSPLLFDVAPDLDEYNPHLYTIRIGPILHQNLFDSENMNDVCHASESETQQSSIDLDSIYNSYEKCKHDSLRFIKYTAMALMKLGVFNDSSNIEQLINLTVINIDAEIIQNFFHLFPPQSKIHEAYSMKNYSIVSLEQLNETTTFINWYHLISLLIGNNTKMNNGNMQVYFYDELVTGLQHLENFWRIRPMGFHNALLGLYAQKLYHELVVSKHEDMKQHCLRVSVNLLSSEASNLYMSSLSDQKITYMNRTVRKFFDDLKETLQTQIEKIKWTTDEERRILLTKINDLTLSIPEISYFQYKKNNRFYLSDNYMRNSLILMKRYRSSIYSVISSVKNPNTPEQIWTHYATPFQTKCVIVYGLHLVIIPFGAIDYGNMFIEKNEANYLVWATIGNLIARQISHHFDRNGIHYWNQTRHYNSFLLSNNGLDGIFESYVTCQNNMYEDQMSMILPLTSQTISFKILGHTLNERLSEIMGLRLTYDTLERLKLFSENPLPWLELNVKQLFYLTYAQMYCTKSLLSTSYVSLHEDKELPSRIRVLVSASNENLLGGLWDCKTGSPIVPSYTCNVFPYLEDIVNTEVFSA